MTNIIPYNKPISQIIRERIQTKDGKFLANHNISEFISEDEINLLTQEVADKFQGVLESLIIDTENDHNTQDTANRVAKMFVKEIFSGRYEPMPKVTAFPNVEKLDQLYISGPITIRSMCAHHMMPISGRAYIGVFPGENVIGLSKFNRIADWFSSRPQIQEELTSQIAKAIQEETKATGVGVVIQAEHFCMSHRGVKEHASDMTTSVMLGELRESEKLKAEFFALLSRMK